MDFYRIMANQPTENNCSKTPDANSRPSKRVRITTTSEPPDSRSPARSSAVVESTPRTRGPTACEKCRSRKTRCDNRRPCGYCAKHQLTCVYDDNDTNQAPSVTGEQLLEAIGSLSDLVRRQTQRHDWCCQQAGHLNLAHESNHDRSEWSTAPRKDSAGYSEGVSATPSPYERSLRLSPLQSQGIEALLTWEPLIALRPSSSTFDTADEVEVPSSQLPNIDHKALSRLEEKYIIGVHTKNPFLDLSDLHNKILQVAENGLDWSTRTCLVTLVCAIGALTQRYHDPANVSITTPSPGVVRSSVGYESDAELATQFWGIAARRLGFAVGQNDIESVQCLCLAGIWYMHRMDALSAWKYFNLAGAAWHAVNMTETSSQGWLRQETDSAFTVMQSLYFTIWKSDCFLHITPFADEFSSELKFEIDVPGPILDNVEFPHAFPLPPDLNDQAVSPGHAQTEQTWYYYLAEIAARHTVNRIVRTHLWNADSYTETQIRQMIGQADEFEKQAHQWYLSLPPMFFFKIPAGYEQEQLPSELAFILRQRYFRCRELVGRPFLRMCVEKPLEIDAQLRSRVASLASQCLKYCLLRASNASPQFHQGTWFLLRNITSSTLMLGAASIAQRHPDLLGAQEMIIPEGWKDLIGGSVENLGPYWEQKRGGLPEMKRLIDAVLASCSEVE